MSNQQTYAPGTHPDLPPPADTIGAMAWVKGNLLSSKLNIFITVFTIYLLYLIVPGLIDWAFLNSVYNAESRNECRAIMDASEGGRGACWAFIGHRFNFFIYGFYPESERWRAITALIVMFAALVPILYDSMKNRKLGLYFSLASPVIIYWLLVGGMGLEPVGTEKFGGIMLTLVIGVTGIVCSLPLGIGLALGRQSHLPAMRIVCVVFIEFIRGVPLITLLFVASTMLNYFLPPGTTFDLLLRVLIMVTLFSAAYIAEVVRGGLQAIPNGQIEAADAMGLKYWQSMRLIVLPQALKISIPGIVNTFIGLYKDSTLVIIIGLFDVLGAGRASLADTKWQGLSTEVYVFVALFFFVSCIAMARYSLYLENKLHTGHKR
ncbi:MAG: general L-amino acid transport system permease protein [Gammaproteobacteria bacterium]|jgi:general L-amino acid transport system permease protein